jgi:hypothetical protein
VFFLFRRFQHFTFVVRTAGFANVVCSAQFTAFAAGDEAWHTYFPSLCAAFVASGFGNLTLWANGTHIYTPPSNL